MKASKYSLNSRQVMEQMYLIEIFIDKVTIFASSEDEQSGANKKLIVKIKFGPKVEFIIKEGQLALNEDTKDDIIDCDENGRRKWTRTIRVGKSYLFPSYPDTVLMTLSKFPLEIEVWNDDENEVEIFVGIGTMHWHTQFFHMLKESAEACKIHEPLSMKQDTPLFAECCCRQVGDISFILRLSALGESIITEFQQLMNDPDNFVFRTNKAPSMFQCKRIEGDDPSFCMAGSLYETTTLEDPTVTNSAQQKIEICTELQSCGVEQRNDDFSCKHDAQDSEESTKKKHTLDKIRMGDITGPCGNTNCPLAHKVKMYIRNLEAYKRETEGKVMETKDATTRNVCGSCICKDDRWHREECPENQNKETRDKVDCSGCGGKALAGETCEDRKNKMYGTGVTPKSSKTTVAYVFNVTKVPGFKEATCPKSNTQNDRSTHNEESIETTDCCCNRSGCTWKLYKDISLNEPHFNLEKKTMFSEQTLSCPPTRNESVVYSMELKDAKVSGFKEATCPKSYSQNDRPTHNEESTEKTSCCCNRSGCTWKVYKDMSLNEPHVNLEKKTIFREKTLSFPPARNEPVVYNMEVKDAKRKGADCVEISEDKDCKCKPPKPAPPCMTFDCECLTEISNIAARKAHKPFCPLYKHKSNCPVTMMQEDEEMKKADNDDDEAEPLPYGLPPIKLGPCPVLGRPCTVPDGFARMYKTAALTPQPPSYSDAGKVCCSKEYERIKKAIKNYMKYEKDDDFRCVNKFIVDTERRCCDKEQKLLSLMGKGCCGSHKLAIQEKFKEEKK